MAIVLRNNFGIPIRGSSSTDLTYYAPDTYANIVATYPAASYAGRKAICNDLGFYGTEIISTGSRWIPVNGTILHTKLTLSCYVAPSFTGTTNGAITFSTAFAAADPQCYVYYPAGSIVAGQPGGLYYTVMSSTTNATVYNNVYTPAAGVFPAIPASLTAFSGAVPGGGGSSGVEVTIFISPVIPGGLLGYYGSILSQFYCEAVANANSKTFRMKLGATNIASNTVGASPHFGGTHICSNHGSPGYQKSQGTLLNNVTTGVTLTGLVNTANDQSVTLTVQTNAAGDWAGWVNYQMTLGVNS